MLGVEALLVREPPGAPKIQAIVITHGCSSELDGQALFLKTPCTLVLGHSKINLKLTGKLPAG